MKTELGRLARRQARRGGAGARSADAGVAAPELDGQEDHEEGVGAQVGRVGKVRVERGRAHRVLHEREPRRLPAHHGDEPVAQRIPPAGESSCVCSLPCRR